MGASVGQRARLWPPVRGPPWGGRTDETPVSATTTNTMKTHRRPSWTPTGFSICSTCALFCPARSRPHQDRDVEPIKTFRRLFWSAVTFHCTQKKHQNDQGPKFYDFIQHNVGIYWGTGKDRQDLTILELWWGGGGDHRHPMTYKTAILQKLKNIELSLILKKTVNLLIPMFIKVRIRMERISHYIQMWLALLSPSHVLTMQEHSCYPLMRWLFIS